MEGGIHVVRDIDRGECVGPAADSLVRGVQGHGDDIVVVVVLVLVIIVIVEEVGRLALALGLAFTAAGTCFWGDDTPLSLSCGTIISLPPAYWYKDRKRGLQYPVVISASRAYDCLQGADANLVRQDSPAVNVNLKRDMLFLR